jgi:hypothetical protein
MDVLSQLHLGYFVVVFAAYFLVIGVAACLLIARFGGWSALAARYRTERLFPAHQRRFQSGRMRTSISYNNILTVASDQQGIILGLPFFLRLAHPRLFIPWAEIEIEEPTQWFFLSVQTLLLGPERVPLRLRTSLVDFLLKAKAVSDLPDDPMPNPSQI